MFSISDDTPLPQVRRDAFFVVAVHADGQTYLIGRADGRPFQSRQSAQAVVTELETEDQHHDWDRQRMPVYLVRPIHRP
jgi:hypothetical protein